MGHITVDRISEVGRITLHSLLLVSVLILPLVGYLLWLAAATTVDRVSEVWYAVLSYHYPC